MLRNWITRKLIDRRRRLFAFWDGQRTVRMDPMVIIRRLSEHETYDPENDFKRLRNPSSKARGKAIAYLAGVVRDAFQLPEFDGKTGLAELELLNLLNSFNKQMDALKKNMQPTPESSPSTAASGTPADSPSETSTSDTSASGSTSTEP